MTNNLQQNKKDKKPLYKRWWVWLVGGFLLFNIIGVIAVGTSDADDEDVAEVEESGGKLEGDDLIDNQKEKLRKTLDELVESSEGVLIEVDFNNAPENGNQMKVLVSDSWYESSKQDKERFLDAVTENVSYAVWNSGLQEHGDVVKVDFYDGYDRQVAKHNFVTGNHKIIE